MSEYKPGSWTTKDGHKVVIFEVSDKIYGKLDKNGTEWDLDGRYIWDDDHSPTTLDLAPIEKPKRRFEAFVHPDGKLQTFLIGSSDHNYVSNQGCWTRLPEKDFECD